MNHYEKHFTIKKPSSDFKEGFTFALTSIQKMVDSLEKDYTIQDLKYMLEEIIVSIRKGEYWKDDVKVIIYEKI